MAAELPLDSRLQAVIDKQDIYEVLMRYCRGCDRGDEELLASVFHPDAVDDHDAGDISNNGREFAVRVARNARLNPHPSMRVICNVLIDLDGDVAHVESYFFGVSRAERETGLTDDILGGRYIDRFERRDGEWKIAHRVVVRDWNRIEPVRDIRAAWPGYLKGLKSREDVSYRR